jgi:undecaprenyl-diphosphatase
LPYCQAPESATVFALLAAPSFDLDLLSLLNRPGTPWLDAVMAAASNRGVLLAIAALAAIYLWVKSPHRGLAALLLALAIGGADLLSVRLVKPEFDRIRPCKADPAHVRYPIGCGSGQSFPSTHASDTAAAAAVFAWAAPKLSAVGIAIALLVGVSRVYLGVHWPTDVIAGWVLGAAVGAALVSIARLRYLR